MHERLRVFRGHCTCIEALLVTGEAGGDLGDVVFGFGEFAGEVAGAGAGVSEGCCGVLEAGLEFGDGRQNLKGVAFVAQLGEVGVQALHVKETALVGDGGLWHVRSLN